MDLSNKLKNLPPIYYFNLDQDRYRREYMEGQFAQHNIKHFSRVSGTKFLASNPETWKHLLIGDYKQDLDYLVTNFITHIDFLHWWLNNTQEEMLIIFEDDYDISLIDYWHFDWTYLMDHLPANWDCIQLGWEHPEVIIFCLHFKPPLDHLFGPCLLNRRFVKKIVDLYYYDGMFKINNRTGFAESFPMDCPYSVDTCIIGDGVTYRIPLITTNYKMCKPDRQEILKWHQAVAHTYHYWWRNKRDLFSLDDFFCYAHPRVDDMAESVKGYIQNV